MKYSKENYNIDNEIKALLDTALEEFNLVVTDDLINKTIAKMNQDESLIIRKIPAYKKTKFISVAASIIIFISFVALINSNSIFNSKKSSIVPRDEIARNEENGVADNSMEMDIANQETENKDMEYSKTNDMMADNEDDNITFFNLEDLLLNYNVVNYVSIENNETKAKAVLEDKGASDFVQEMSQLKFYYDGLEKSQLEYKIEFIDGTNEDKDEMNIYSNGEVEIESTRQESDHIVRLVVIDSEELIDTIKQHVE